MLVPACLGCLLILAVGGTAPALAVRGDTACPTAAEVSAALVGLVAPRDPPAAPDVVELSSRGAVVSVTLANDAGVIAVRRLPATMSCAERARAAAVIVAAWEVRLPPPVPASAPEPAAPPPAVARAPVSVPVPVPAQPRADDFNSDTERLAASATARASAGATAGPIDVESGAALLASVAGGGVSPAVMVEATFARRDSRFAVGVGGLAVGTHSTTVGAGEGTWRRLGGFVDLRSISRWRTLDLELHVGLALTALTVTGRSLPVTSGATILDPGALVGLRLRVPLGRLSPWVQATAALWPRAHDLTITGADVSTELSVFEAFLGVGFSLGPDR